MSGYVDFDALIQDLMLILVREGVDESSFNKNRALYAIKRAYIEFVKRSNLIRRTYLVDGQANVNEYPLFKQDGYVIQKIYSVSLGCECYSPAKFCVCNCCPYTYNYQDGLLNLCPAPDCDGRDIEVCASVFPDSKECQMEERIYELYGYEIASGAAHGLLSKQASIPYQIEFEHGIGRASSEAARSWSRGTQGGKRTRWVRR